MAQSSNTKRKSTSGRTTKRTGTGTAARSTSAKKKQVSRQEQELWYEVGLIVLFAFMVFLFLCNFGLVGPVGVFFKNIMLGLFGLMAYVFPIVLFLTVFFGWVNRAHYAVKRKLVCMTFLYVLTDVIAELFAGRLSEMKGYQIAALYRNSVEHGNGGGVIGGSIAYALHHYLDMWGSIFVIVILLIICMVFITERSFVQWVQRTGTSVANKARTGTQDMREYASERARTREVAYYEQLALNEAQLEGREGAPKLPDRHKKVSGVNFNTIFRKLSDAEAEKEAPVTESLVQEKPEQREPEKVFQAEAYTESYAEPVKPEKKIQITSETVARALPETDELHELRPKTNYHPQTTFTSYERQVTPEYIPPKAMPEEPAIEEVLPPQTVYQAEKPVEIKPARQPERKQAEPTAKPVAKPRDKSVPANQMSMDMSKLYQFPPISLLQRGKAANPGAGRKHLEETARRLQDCLHTFGVNVTITDISQGPAVTRYELQPEQGVKVSKIVNLSDDIKLNLAATDIRIEAPIPGKSAIGIEVPNKENSAVAFRELVESPEFKEFPSKISFAVGKDIAGKIVVADIAKMPHMLIAGSTGSGKSVCINTLIMSILYKAHPDEVKMIMIDPKVVELSAYNGIPHLLIPVVTDPKQAAGALQWGVSEMMSRYEKFAECNVRDMKGYNAKIDERIARGEADVPRKLPQIVIIVDELADLMMVAPGEVEEAICRLAQLARAAGIHLIIATQRPSVDVITGLIKANMPSRVAFAVSSGVDSRTILDMNGAEKLLGKGDMLFYPQGYSKPVRIQGSFVSDAEVGAVVDFLKNQQIGNVYQEEIQNQINNLKSGSAAASGSAGSSKSDDKDALFADAGRFIIEKDKASIGMLQRIFKIGFNRAARIMDQLCEYGVVGEEEGTKPRKVLMSLEQFENLLEEI